MVLASDGLPTLRAVAGNPADPAIGVSATDRESLDERRTWPIILGALTSSAAVADRAARLTSGVAALALTMVLDSGDVFGCC